MFERSQKKPRNKTWNFPQRMKKTLLFVLTLSGLSALSPNIVREYHHVQMSKTWAEAQSYCREMFADLATVENEEESNRLMSILQGSGTSAWIGLRDDLTRWKWSLGNADFSTGRDFNNWGSGQPNNRNSKQNCTAMTQYGTWFDQECSTPHPAVCYDEQGPSSFIAVAGGMTWHQAQSHCRSEYTDLVTVRTRSENDQLTKTLSKSHWIGLHRERWDYWSDHSPTSFTNWNTGQPDNPGASCAIMETTTGKWLDTDCEESHFFVCQSPILHRTMFKLKFESDADLNDPAIQQQMLEQLHARLEKHGLPDVKLRWIETEGQTFHKEQKGKEEEGSSG